MPNAKHQTLTCLNSPYMEILSIYGGFFMYRYRAKETKHPRIKRFITLCIIVICVAIDTILLHNMYLGIEIKPLQKEEVSQTNVTLTRSLEESRLKGKEISEMIEKVSHSIVGISKIKNTGNTVFLSDANTELGLGTGVIITDSRIYFDK